MRHVLRLTLGLYLLWLALSGHTEPRLLALGLASSALVVLVTHRMDVLDREAQPPLGTTWRGLRYWPWLGWQIVLANLDVARRILDPRLPIEPGVTRVPAGLRTRLGQVIYANSVTLTPGTVTLDIENGTLTVHSLTRAAARDLESGEMERRVRSMEGPS